MIYLLPWKFNYYGGAYYRERLFTKNIQNFSAIWQNAIDGKWYTSCATGDPELPHHNSFEEAAIAADKFLIDRYHACFISEDRASKLLLLK